MHTTRFSSPLRLVQPNILIDMMDGLLFPSTQNFESTYRIVVMVLVVDSVYPTTRARIMTAVVGSKKKGRWKSG